MRKIFVYEKPNSFGVDLQSSSFFLLTASLLIASLFFSLFVLPISYTYDEICPKCQGDGNVTCETCHGSGTCWICNGTGEIWYMPETDNWCAACRGTGRCYTCGGKGWHICGKCEGTGLLVHWMYNLLGATVALSFISVLSFLALFILGYVGAVFYLSFNEWVYEVEDMGFWFNPSFMTWLFARHRKRWVKWQTVLNLILSISFGVLLFLLMSLKQITQETLVTGTLIGIPVMILFSILFYKAYISRLEASS